jgi:hypothetical protein
VNKLEDKIGALIEQLEKGIDFSKGQAPIIVEQLLTYDLVVAVGWIVIFSLMLGFIVYRIYNIAKKASYYDDGAADTGYIIGFLVIILIILNIITIVKITIAPNLYVLDYLKGLL